MLKHAMAAAALAAVLATPAFAQSGSHPVKIDNANPATSVQSSRGAFVNTQNASEWRSSKLVGANVYGPDNKKIGDINDLLVDASGNIRAAVIGVGGFLGVGEKDVAVPFDALTITRKLDSTAIDKITVSYNKDELKNAPKFTWYQPSGAARQTTGSSSSMNGSSSTMPSAPSRTTPLTHPAPSSK